MTDSLILTYHSLDDSESVISTSPELFRAQMKFLADSGIPVVPLAETVPNSGSVAITFDDGFRNVAEHAFATLEHHKFPATIFVVGGYCGGRNNWPTQPKGSVPDLPLLDWNELKSLPPGVTIGAHTMSHPHLEALSPTECERELAESRIALEQRLGYPVRSLAYPYGTSTREVRRVAARHFDLAVGTTLGFMSGKSDPMDLPRIDTYYLRSGFTIDRLFSATAKPYIGFRRLLRNARALLQ